MHVGICSSRTPGTPGAASHFEFPKLRLPATSALQDRIGGFRITLCCRSEFDWLNALAAHVLNDSTKGRIFERPKIPPPKESLRYDWWKLHDSWRSISQRRKVGTSSQTAQSHKEQFYKRLRFGGGRSFGSENSRVSFGFGFVEHVLPLVVAKWHSKGRLIAGQPSSTAAVVWALL